MTPTIVVRDGGVTRVAGPGVTIAVAGGAVASVDGLVGVVSLPTNAAAGTGSKRTLGTGATEAAAGNHTHPLSALTNLTTYMGIVLAQSDDAAEAQSNLGIDLSGYLPRALPINSYAVSRTITAADFDALQTYASTGALVATVPPASTLTWPQGRSTYFRRGDSGALSIAPGPGVTIHYEGGKVTGKYVEDTFTAADGTNLEAHTGQTGATWTIHPSYAVSAKIQTNRLHNNSSSGSKAYYASAVPESADYDVAGHLYQLTDAGVAGVIGRVSTTVDTYYLFRYFASTTNLWELWKFVAGTPTLLDSAAETLVNTDERDFNLEMRGSAIKGYVEGLEVVSVVDTAITGLTAGVPDPAKIRAGVRVSQSTSIAGVHLDSVVAAPDTDALGNAPSLANINSGAQLIALPTPNEFWLFGSVEIA